MSIHTSSEEIDRAMKKRRLNDSQQPSTVVVFDNVTVSLIFEMLGLIGMTRVCTVNKSWYTVSEDIWKLLIEKRIGFVLPVTSCGIQWMTDVKLDITYSQAFDQVMNDPIAVQSDMSVVRTALKSVSHKRYREKLSGDFMDVSRFRVSPNLVPTSTSDLIKLKDHIAFGYVKYKLVYTNEGTDGDSRSHHKIINFSIYDPERKVIVLFRAKSLLQYNKVDNSKSKGIFEVMATVYDMNGKQQSYDQLTSFYKYREDGTNNIATLGADYIVAWLCFIDTVLKVDRSKLQSISQHLGYSGIESLTKLIVYIVGYASVHEDTELVRGVLTPTIEERIMRKEQVDLAEFNLYVEGLCKRDHVIQSLASGHSMFHNYKDSSAWMDRGSPRYTEVMKLANNIVVLYVNCEKIGEADTIGTNLDQAVYIKIKSLDGLQMAQITVSVNGDAYEDEVFDLEIHIMANYQDCLLEMYYSDSMKFNEKLLESLRSMLGCQHLTTNDIADLVADWCEQKDAASYEFLFSVFRLWSKSVVPDIENYQL